MMTEEDAIAAVRSIQTEPFNALIQLSEEHVEFLLDGLHGELTDGQSHFLNGQIVEMRNHVQRLKTWHQTANSG